MGYKRVLLKVSGETFKGPKGAYDPDAILYLTDQIQRARDVTKVQLAIVPGGGNVIRGSSLIENLGIDTTRAHIVAMNATIMNGLALKACLVKDGLPQDSIRVMSKAWVPEGGELFDFEKARHALDAGQIVIIVGGIGTPGITTDSAAVFLAPQVGAEVAFKGTTKVDGVYDENPDTAKEKPNLLQKISYADFLNKGLSGIFDRPAVAHAQEIELPIVVFKISESGNLLRAINGMSVGTLISS